LVFCTVMVIVVVPPRARLETVKAFVTTGAANTFKAAEAAVPVVATGVNPTGALVVLVIEPTVLDVTFTWAWQLDPAAILPVVNRILLSPPALAPPAILVTVPQAAGVKVNVVLLNVNPAGNVSSACIVVAPGFAAGLLKVKVSVVLPPEAIVAAPKALVSVGAAYTFSVALAAVPAGAFVLVTGPVLLTFAPTVAPVTTTL
jgi:hypothetical protein